MLSDPETGRLQATAGIWSFGPAATRYVPQGTHSVVAAETTAARVQRAVEQIGDVVGGFEFHAPGELSAATLADVQTALDGRDVYCVATGMHAQERFARGALISSDAELRGDALGEMLAGIDVAGSISAHFILWTGVEGYDHPFQIDYRSSWQRLLDAVIAAAERCEQHGVQLLLEPKSSGPHARNLLRDCGMALHAVHAARDRGLRNVRVVLDFSNLAMTGEHIAEYAALLMAEDALGHLHANAGWGSSDYNMVGTTGFMETVELALELRRGAYGSRGERICFDVFPSTEDAGSSIRRSIAQWRVIEQIAARIDEPRLRAAQDAADSVGAWELVYDALGQPVG